MSFVLSFWGQGEAGRSGASGKAGGPRQGSKCKAGVGFLFIGSQGMTGPALCSTVEQERRRPCSWLPASPRAGPPGTRRDPVSPPLDKHSVLSQDGALEVKEQMWKGRGDEKDPLC